MIGNLRVDIAQPRGLPPGSGSKGGAGFSAAVLQTRRGDDAGDLLVLAQRRGMRGGAGPLRMPGGGFAEVSPVEELRLFRFNRALRTIQRLEPTNREATFMSAPNQPPSEEWTRKLEEEATFALMRQQAGQGAGPARAGAPAGSATAARRSEPAAIPAEGAPPFLQFQDWDMGKAGVRADGTPYAPVRGTVRNLDGWHTEPFTYAKRDPAVTRVLRDQFDATGRADFCENLALQHRPELEAAGLTGEQIASLSMGRPPAGYEVHHIHPLDGGGTNALGNLVLMRNNAEHLTVTAFQGAVRRGMQPGDTRQVAWPMPPAGTVVWPARPPEVPAR